MKLIIIDSFTMPYRSVKDPKESAIFTLEVVMKKLLKIANKFKIAVYFLKLLFF